MIGRVAIRAAAAAGIGFAVCALGCLSDPPAYQQEVVHESCTEAEIRIIEQVDERPFPDRGYAFRLELWARTPSGSGRWRHVDEASKRTPVYTHAYRSDQRFSRLLPDLPPLPPMSESERERIAALAAESHPTSWTYRESFYWDVFVDPAQFDASEYEALRHCLASRIEPINTALATPREPVPDEQAYHPDRYLPIVSIVHAAYDYHPSACDTHSVGPIVSCPAALRIQLTPPNLVRLERVEACAVVGVVTDDQQHVLLRPPSGRAFADLASIDPVGFYGACRASDGSALSRYFTQVEWQRGEAGWPRERVRATSAAPSR
jgi:hypothetical protein